jgi:signal transduction histidine kinase
MRERVWALHGDIAIVSDGGTRIMIRLPLPPPELPKPA